MRREIQRALNLAKLAKRKKPPVGMTPADVIHTENKWRLLRYQAKEGVERTGTPILLVPSLINRHYVLDLLPDKSFAAWLVGQGHDVFCIDWGTPGPEDRFLTFDDITDRYIGRALRRCAEHGTDDPRAPVHVLGYCLGGTLATIHAARHPERFASLLDLAAPVAFGDDGLLEAWTRTKTFDISALVEAFGNVPWQLMQAAFHMLRPTLNLAKIVHMVDRAWDDEFLDGFHALETWGADNVSFPGACYETYIEQLYRNDALVKGDLVVAGERVKLSNITCPTLAITFEHDNIVPASSAAALLDHVSSKDKERLHLPGGHVGAVVSRAAAKRLWPQISAFFRKHDVVPPKTQRRGSTKRAVAQA